MADVYLTIADAGNDVVGPLADILERRAADPQQRAMREDYLAGVGFGAGARVVEVGCGTGAVARALAARADVGEVVGVDPSPVFLERARELAGGLPGLSFVEGDARKLPFDADWADVVVCHTVLCHVPGPEAALAEACRILRPGGRLAVFDGDYATTTFATGPVDPLQACAQACLEALVHDPWLARRLPALLRDAGFADLRLRGHSYLEAPASDGYLLALADRGADALLAAGRVGAETAAALKAEARRRCAAGEFFGHIAYLSAIATKPGGA
jgi:SAM-dependent methyltransferase